MRVLEAVKRVRDGTVALPELWSIATRPERVAVALILGLPAELPRQAATPALAWRSINRQQQRMVLRYAPLRIRACLPAEPDPPARPLWRDGVVVGFRPPGSSRGAAPRLAATG